MIKIVVVSSQLARGLKYCLCLFLFKIRHSLFCECLLSFYIGSKADVLGASEKGISPRYGQAIGASPMVMTGADGRRSKHGRRAAKKTLLSPSLIKRRRAVSHVRRKTQIRRMSFADQFDLYLPCHGVGIFPYRCGYCTGPAGGGCCRAAQ